MNIIFITGMTGCGKTTLARAEADRLGIPVIGLRDVYQGVVDDYVRRDKTGKFSGVEHIRDFVERMGVRDSLVLGKMALGEAIRRETDNGRSDVVVDDLPDYHTMTHVRDIFVRDIFDADATIVYLDADEEVRAKRHAKEMRVDLSEGLAWVRFWDDNFRIKAEIGAVRLGADLIIDNNGSLLETQALLDKYYMEAELFPIRGGVERS